MARFYSSDDLHAASMVWWERYETIKALLVRETPHLRDVDVLTIVSGCRLYSTCGEAMFSELEASVTTTSTQEVA